MVYEGKTVKNITLVPNEMSTIQYTGTGFYADIINNGPGIVYINWEKEPFIGDPDSLTLKSDQAYTVRVRLNESRILGKTIDLNIIGASPSWVQVVRAVI